MAWEDYLGLFSSTDLQVAIKTNCRCFENITYSLTLFLLIICVFGTYYNHATLNGPPSMKFITVDPKSGGEEEKFYFMRNIPFQLKKKINSDSFTLLFLEL